MDVKDTKLDYHYVDIKKIQKIHVFVIFSFIILLLAAIVPLFLLTELNTSTTVFQNSNVSGEEKLDLSSTVVNYVLTLYNLNSHLTNNLSSFIRVHLIFNLLTSFTLQFSLPSNTSFPVTFNTKIQLKSNIYYSANYNINSIISISTTGVRYHQIVVLNSTLGHFNLLLYFKWFFLELIGSFLLLISVFIYIKKKHSIHYFKIYREYFKLNFKSYEQFLSSLDQNSSSLIVIIPIFILFTILYQYYLHFSLFIGIISFLHQNIFEIGEMLLLQSILIIFFPLIPVFLINKISKENLNLQTKVLDLAIFEPLFIALYFVALILTNIFPNKDMYIIVIILMFILSSLIYFITMKHHCWKYGFKISNPILFILSFISRIIYSILIILLLQFTGLFSLGITYYYLIL